MLRVLQYVSRAIHTGPGIGIDREPVGPVGVVFKLRRRKQSIISRMLSVAVDPLRSAALLRNPVHGFLHTGPGMSEPASISRVKIMLGQRPQYSPVIQSIIVGRVVVNLVDFGAVENTVRRAALQPGEVARSLQFEQGLQILRGGLGGAQRIQQQNLEARLVGEKIVEVAGGGHHVESALGILGCADVDVRDERA